MRKLYLFLAIILTSSSLMAQTPQQLSRVLMETNTAKLQAKANIWKQQSEERKAIAVEAALQNGWPITISTDSSFAEIQKLDESGQPMYYITNNKDAAITTSTNKLYSGGGLGLNLDGSGMTAGEWDGGAILITHEEFNNTGTSRVTQEDSPSSYSYHATHVAGTIIGHGYYTHPDNGANSKGMANNAILKAYDWNSDEAEMASEATNGLLISNHSYGWSLGWSGSIWVGNDNYFGYYDSQAEEWDQIAVDAPYYLIVKSAGNDRGEGPGNDPTHPDDGPYDCIGPKAVSKNILTVGAVEDLASGYSGDPNDVVMSSFSSWGPVDDGRIKPDICGNGVGVLSAFWSDSDPTGTGYYAFLSGTSMAAPNVTGSLLLLQEHYYNLNSAYMKSATLKALAIQTADECGPNTGPDYMFGWGLLNAKTAANVITNRNISNVIKEETYSGTTYNITVTANGIEPLHATLVWTDPAGTSPSIGAADAMLVNDLDMSITGAKSTYLPYKLDKDNPSNAATTGDNDVDNVEQVHIASPSAGSYTIAITHDGSITGGSQNFSLIVTGIIIDEPAVLTFEPSSITASSAYVSGEVTSENGSAVIERGFVYSTSVNPDINDTKVIIGSGTGTFNTSLSSLNPNTTYHVRAYARNTSGYGYGVDKDFTTTSTTTWDGSSWDGGAPIASTHAIINGNYTTSADFNCNNLTINSGKIFNNSVNDGVTVNGAFLNNGSFNILSNASGIGSFITHGSVTNNGSFNMQRYVTENAWHYISSPLSGNTSGVFEGAFLQKWDEVTATWSEITATGESLVKGKGYSLWSNSKTSTFTMSGTPYSNNQSIGFTKTSNGSGNIGANLLGNPFPSSIDWNSLDSEGYASVYTYDGDNEQYLSYNDNAGSGSRYIAPGQGFFIIAEYTGSFNLGNADRTHLGTTNFVKEEKSIENGLVLIASSSDISDEYWLSFSEESSPNYEKKYDAYKFFSNRGDLPHIYSIINGQKLSIDKRPETELIQLGIKIIDDGNYQLQIQQSNGLSSIEVEDIKLQKIHDLNTGSYSFNWQNGDSEERFKLHLSATSTNEIIQEEAQVYTWGESVYIRNNADAPYSSVQIIDLAGRVIYKGTLKPGELNQISLKEKNGVYLVQLNSASQSQTEKVIIGQ